MITQLETDQIRDDASLQDWLEQQAAQHQFSYLLAHAEDGVIWGHFPEMQLRIAHEVFSEFPKLRLSTLQQCRIFGEEGEMLLWRDQMTLRSRLVVDERPAKCDEQSKHCIEEDQILWGKSGGVREGFTKLQDGQQGLSHAVPLVDIPFGAERRPVRLRVHHYIQYNKSGIARIYLSRLVKLFSEP
jgi:CRISPR-associated protein (TIGR03984 family)